MRLHVLTVVVPLALLSAPPSRQQPPSTEVYLRPVDPPVARDPATFVADSPSSSSAPWFNISNSPGYDNQPSFLPDSSAVFFSSNRDGKQTDIYRYDIASKALTQLTRTADSEYSPLVTPDGKGFSVIRQAAADGTQLLYRYDLDGSNPRVVLENVKPVGYHAWIDATHLALFILGGQGQPATLQIADTTTGRAEVVATGIGRSILIRPGAGTVSFITTGQGRMIKEWDPKTRQIADIFPPWENSQDAAWTSREALLMASGTAIAEIRRSTSASLPGFMTDSKRFTFTIDPADPTSPPIANITRLAVSPNGQWLAFVAEPRPAGGTQAAAR